MHGGGESFLVPVDSLLRVRAELLKPQNRASVLFDTMQISDPPHPLLRSLTKAQEKQSCICFGQSS